MASQPLAVIDIGSNSGRIIVVRLTKGGHLEILSDARVGLRLMRDIDSSGRLSAQAEERTLAALHDFIAVAAGSGADRTIALATAAVREAGNGPEFVARLRQQTGLDIRVISGDEEARLAFSGAVNGLPVDHGMLVDVGGGSLELARFRARRAVQSWTLPLGSLRLTDRFLSGDPPKQGEATALQEHVARTLRDAGVGGLREDEKLVGTGGTIRNLAKMHRATVLYPIPRLHGYTITRKALRDLVVRVVSRRLSRRSQLPGLSTDRADSIAGGALVVQAVLETLGAPEVTVSGQGLREGAVYEEAGQGIPATAEVRRASITAIASRFTTWDSERARRRTRIALSLWDEMRPNGEDAREALEHAATILDVGRSVDYYRRWEHAAEIVVSADLYGFSHRSIAMIAALIVRAGNRRTSLETYSTLADARERRNLGRGAVLLALADEVERRIPKGSAASVTQHTGKNGVVLVLPVPHDWVPVELAGRFQRVFGRELSIEPGNGGVARDALTLR
ncbi:MAG: Ppx/GppA family phosphatase [Candidatus Dormibacteraeota bacterium]|nr:Ppx/GppA family phosphatase [Candidatus Dormibacteraeota bacterium]